MDLTQNLLMGFQSALEPMNVLFCLVGVLMGTLIGVLPGIGPTTTIAMLLPLTLSLSPATALIMLAGIYYGAQYGGSTTAILINLPGEPSSVVTAMDGFAMAKEGRAGPALSAAAIASFFAGTVSTFCIAIFALPLATFALEFGPAEYFSLMVLGLITSIALAKGSLIKAVGMIVCGLLLGLVGDDVYTGEHRFSFGQQELYDGIDFVALALGIFGLAEIMRNLDQETDRERIVAKIGRLWPSRDDLQRISLPAVRGTAIGSLLGILPGGGAMLASFAAYSLEKKVSKTPQRFGHGAIEGVAAPEAANNAGAQMSFIPMLTLGIPSNAVMALMVGAIIIQGIVPGPSIATEQPELFWGVITSMWIGNLMLVILNLPLVGLWVRLLSVPYRWLFPTIVIFACLGVYSINNSSMDLYVAAFIGVLGYVLVRLDCEPTPLILGFVFGPMIEENLRRAMLMSRGDPMVFVESPISLVLLLMAFAFVLLSALPHISRKRNQIFADEG